MTPKAIETLRLLAVSSEPSVLRLLGSVAQSNEWHMEAAASGWDAMEQVQSGTAPHVVLLDIPRGESEGLQLLPWLRRLRPQLPIVVFCDPGDDATQKEATRLGAKNVLLRPFTEHQMVSAIQRLLGISNEAVFAEMSSEDIESLGEDEFFLSVSPAMRQLRAQAELLAQSRCTRTRSWGTWKWKRHGCTTDPSAVCALWIQVPASELCGDAGGSPRDRVIWQRKWTRQWLIEIVGQTRDWSEGHNPAGRDYRDAARVTISHSQDSPRKAISSDPAKPRNRKSMSAFLPPAATRWRSRSRRNECTRIFTIVLVHSL